MCVDFDKYYREYYAYLFDHIDEFIALKDAIVATPEIYSHDGGGTTCIFGKKKAFLFREFELRFGDLITLYANGQWCDREKNVFLYKMLQSPLPGGGYVKVYGWNNEEKEFETNPSGFPDTETLFEQAHRVAQYKPQAGKKKIPLETQNRLAALFQPLKEYTHYATDDFKCFGFARPINGQITEKNIQTGVETLLENCAKGQLDRVRYVLNNFPQIFDRADSGDLLCAAAGNIKILRFLIEHGKTTLTVSPIPSACESVKNIEKRVNLLIKLGANVNEKDKNGEPPVVFAARRDYDRVVSCLVRRGADINARDKDGDTPLIVAAKYKNIKTMRKLLLSGADVSIKNNAGDTVRDVMARRKAPADWEDIPDLLNKGGKTS